MVTHNANTLVIVNDRHQPIGILTDRDLMVRVTATLRDPATTQVGDIMTKQPATISEDMPIEQAIAQMQSGGFRRMLVVTTDEHLVGVVSLDDVLRLLAGEFTKIGELLTRVITK
jgi:CBS domain-containing protein